MKAAQDKLFLLYPSFEDPALPGRTFYCEDCALIEGVLATFPMLKEKLEIHRIAYPRPRPEVVALLGEANQWLPLLILRNGDTSVHQTGIYQGLSFVSDKDAILRVLSERHALPLPHP
jgi:hypothetical protein